jgi:hypothetical protein
MDARVVSTAVTGTLANVGSMARTVHDSAIAPAR